MAQFLNLYDNFWLPGLLKFIRYSYISLCNAATPKIEMEDGKPEKVADAIFKFFGCVMTCCPQGQNRYV